MLVGTGVFTRDLFWEDDFFESSEKSLSSDSLAFLFGIRLSFFWFFFVIEDDAFFVPAFSKSLSSSFALLRRSSVLFRPEAFDFSALCAFFRLNFVV
jgi:hypothetical protein